MLKLTAQRGSITIDGNGYTLSGTGDCIIRLDEGCKLTLNDITLHSGSTAIGCLSIAFQCIVVFIGIRRKGRALFQSYIRPGVDSAQYSLPGYAGSGLYCYILGV